jgi:hypothetical protein
MALINWEATHGPWPSFTGPARIDTALLGRDGGEIAPAISVRARTGTEIERGLLYVLVTI